MLASHWLYSPVTLCITTSLFMAQQHQLVVKKPKVLLFDVVSTVAKTSFIDQVLLPYVPSHIKQFLEENWDSKSVQHAKKCC